MLSTNNVNDACEYYSMPSSWAILPKKEALKQNVEVMNKESLQVEQMFRCEYGVPYGENEKEKIDFMYQFNVEKDSTDEVPIVVFFHGGYWEEGDRSMYRCFAKSFHSNEKLIVAIIGYDFSSSTFKVPDIEAQCVKAVEFIHKKFPFSQLILTGHCTGGYLITALLSYSHLSEYIHTVVSLAGFCSTEFLLQSSILKALALDKMEEQNLFRRKLHLDDKQKVFIVNAQRDSPFILMESFKLFEKIKNENPKVEVKLSIIEDEDHFTMIENSLRKDSYISRCIMKLVKEINQTE